MSLTLSWDVIFLVPDLTSFIRPSEIHNICCTLHIVCDKARVRVTICYDLITRSSDISWKPWPYCLLSQDSHKFTVCTNGIVQSVSLANFYRVTTTRENQQITSKPGMVFIKSIYKKQISEVKRFHCCTHKMKIWNQKDLNKIITIYH